jgi:hypothetical protein
MQNQPVATVGDLRFGLIHPGVDVKVIFGRAAEASG